MSKIRYWLDLTCDEKQFIVLANKTDRDDEWFDFSEPLDTLDDVRKFAKDRKIIIPNIDDYKEIVK